MTAIFTPAQSEEIDDRIVEMIAAALGEGEAARRCRAIANKRWLDHETERKDRLPTGREAVPAAWQEMATAPLDRWVLTFCPSAAQREDWPSTPWIIARCDRGRWQDYGRMVVFPTHWMELTAPGSTDAGVPQPGDTITASDVADMASLVVRPMKRVLRP